MRTSAPLLLWLGCAACYGTISDPPGAVADAPDAALPDDEPPPPPPPDDDAPPPPPPPDDDDDDPRPPPPPPDDDAPGDGWRLANLTYFTSYPEPGSEECEDFNGCQWAGHFAFVDGQMSEAWVAAHDIVAVHSDFADTYALHTLRLRQDGREIDVTVYDMCSDSDCSGCCTRNMEETGFLLDLESYTAARFGSSWGVVEWTCLDCE